MNEYLSLLLKYQALPKVCRTVTFMEIAGYPHYENVCSNILKFYFDPAAEHGLGSLLLKAFIKMASQNRAAKGELEISEKVIIAREYPAADEKRIDLVIEAESFILGIENKIYHWEANDFTIYSSTLEALGNGKAVIKAILCLKIDPAQAAPKGGFHRYTYRELWSHVRDSLGHHIARANPKWTTYLNDFMETTSKLAGETQAEKEVTDFFITHHDCIERLLEDRQRLLNRVSATVRSIEGSLQAFPETQKYLGRRWIYLNTCLASHFKIKGATIGLDLAGDLRGWKVTFFQLPRPTRVLAELVKTPEMMALAPNPKKEGERYVLQTWDLHAGEMELQDAMIRCFKALIAAADSGPN